MNRHPRRWGLRLRLTLFYTVVTGVILTLSLGVFYGVLGAQLHQTVDRSLVDAAGLAASQLGGDEHAAGVSEEDPHSLQSQVRASVQLKVFSSSGTPTDQFGLNVPSYPLTEGFQSQGEVRIYTLKLPGGDWVQSSRSQAETLETLSQTQRALLVGLPVLLLLGALVGYAGADRALRPVDLVTRTARDIAESGQTQARVPEMSGDDEMSRLVGTFNQMLERLEETIQREKAFALTAAHELRTPLSVLRARTTLTLEKARSVEEHRQALLQIQDTHTGLMDLVESLLMLAHTDQRPCFSEVNLEDLALEALEAFSLQAREQGVKLHLDSCSVPLQADPTALRVAVHNLVANSLKYGRQRGNIWIRVHQQATQAWLEVEDDGPGIPSGELNRITQPFQRGLGVQGITGSGLGLALVKLVAEQHGAHLVLGSGGHGGLKAQLCFDLPSS